MKQFRGTSPKPYRCALNQGGREVNEIHQVIDTSDGDAVVETFRNKFLADKKAELSPAYVVRSFSLHGVHP